MRFLQLTRKFPYPPLDGESLNLSGFNSILSEKGHDIDLLSFNTIKHYFDINNLPKDKNYYKNIHEVYLDNRLKAKDAFLNLFSKLPYHITRFITKEYENKLKSILSSNQYDFILIESLNLVPYLNIIKRYSNAKIIFRAHNVEYEIWERIGQNTNNIIKKTYIQYLAKQLKIYELSNINKFDLVLTVTGRDLEKYRKNGFSGEGLVVPAGIIAEYYNATPIKISNNLKVSFLGSLDWIPNLEGLNWFIDKIWKQIIKNRPNSELHIAGRNTPQSIVELKNENIIIHGEVLSATDFISSYPIMIVPLLSGGGMRLKILEALALGRVVITTSIGLEGIDAVNNKEVLIANTPVEFIDKLNLCINNPHLLSQISSNAIKLFKEKYDSAQIVESFINHIALLIE